MYNFMFMGYIFICKDKYSRELHILVEYAHIKILLQGNGGVKSIIMKKRYACHINFEGHQ